MSSKIDLSDWDRKILYGILSKYPCTFYAYGSRVKGCARKYSDLDLCYFDKISSDDLMEIKWALEDSDITIKVSVVPVSQFSESFFKSIKEDLVEIDIDSVDGV
jgi:predicted nucleotidyltransferase